MGRIKPKKAARKTGKPKGRQSGPPRQIKADPNDPRIFFVGDDPRGRTLKCPRCGHVLAKNIAHGMLDGTVTCPTCGDSVHLVA